MIHVCKRWVTSRKLINVTSLYCSNSLMHFSPNVCIFESPAQNGTKTRFQKNGSSSSILFNLRYVGRKAGVQEIEGTQRGNDEKRRKESLSGASAWISMGISVATLFYVRDMVWATRGECVGVWRKASARQPLRFLPWCHQTNRTVCDVVHSRSWIRLIVYIRVARTLQQAMHSRLCSHASPRQPMFARTKIAGIRGIYKIPTAHVTTNCCSADRPTHRRSVKL